MSAGDSMIFVSELTYYYYEVYFVILFYFTLFRHLVYFRMCRVRRQTLHTHATP